MATSILKTYLSEIARTRTATQNAGLKDLEHQHRPAMKILLESILDDVHAVNEAGKIEFGAPDFALVRNRLPIGYVETKRLGEDLDDVAKGEQLKRYFGYANLVLTNYLEFRFYKHGQECEEPIIIADLDSLTLDENASTILETTFRSFLEDAVEPIRNAERLATIMGENGKRLRANLNRYLKIEDDRNKPILEIYDVFKLQLIHDLSLEDFADMYAQTLVYGLFVARYHDKTPDDFTRQEARDLIPNTNPLLRRFFDHITGTDFDERLKPIVDELCNVFANSNVQELMKQLYKQDLWGAVTASPDPVIHFYEDFLKNYDSKERKRLGAYYTPPDVVSFIVRFVDETLKRDFSLLAGLSDTAKIPISTDVQGKKVKHEIHKVQVLDPATGTGTFLNETIRLIRSSFTGQEGRFAGYVNEDLLPRIHGFELMMAPYTIAHLKLAATLRESGAKDLHERIGIYLTNSLEKAEIEEGTLFASIGLSQSISEESRAAARIKNDMPIMVVMGNPPYSINSQNKGVWIKSLIKDYKKDLNEKKSNLDDDYIKFIRFSESLIEKSGKGIVAMITNNSYIDGITHRQMRKHLLEVFDDIYILDLHGNSKKKEKAPDGGKDENVFDIQQGVAISIFVRKDEKKKKLATVHHAELWGKRREKFASLNNKNINWNTLQYTKPYYFFVPKDFDLHEEYSSGFALNELFPNYNSGIQTKRDDLTIKFTEKEIEKVAQDFIELTEAEIKIKYKIPSDGRDWKIKWAQLDLQAGFKIKPILYRPFDIRYMAYTGKSKGFIAYPREKTSQHMVLKNKALLFSRSIPEQRVFSEIFISNSPIDLHAAAGQTYCAPLYLYNPDGSRTPNLEREIIKKIEKRIGKDISPEKIVDYIYAYLHSLSYREKYKEFLKIDFPRVPFPIDLKQFNVLADFGKQLSELHLLESPIVHKLITSYPEAGTNKVEKITYDNYKVYINSQQYFGGVPNDIWNFYMGGYQPIQKWLKDRIGRSLKDDDIEHYQQMCAALVATRSVMTEIDKVLM